MRGRRPEDGGRKFIWKAETANHDKGNQLFQLMINELMRACAEKAPGYSFILLEALATLPVYIAIPHAKSQTSEFSFQIP